QRSGRGRADGSAALLLPGAVGDLAVGPAGFPSVDLASEQQRSRPARILREPLGVQATVVVEGVHAATLGDDPVQIDVRDRGTRTLREPLALAEQITALVEEGLAVPGQIGGGLPLPRSGVDVGDLAAGGGGAGHELALLGPADRDRGA